MDHILIHKFDSNGWDKACCFWFWFGLLVFLYHFWYMVSVAPIFGIKVNSMFMMCFSFRGFQRAMIKSMTLAAKIPHFHYVEEINCDALVKLKASFQEENRDPEVKHTFLPFMIKTLSMALSKYPLLNSCFNEELQEITVKGLILQKWLLYNDKR